MDNIYSLDCLCQFCGQYSSILWQVKIGDDQMARTCPFCYQTVLVASAIITTQEAIQKMTTLEKPEVKVKAPIISKRTQTKILKQLEKAQASGPVSTKDFLKIVMQNK